jgi:hypothetical protein
MDTVTDTVTETVMQTRPARRRAWRALLPLLVLGGVVMSSTGCSSSRPPGMLGLRWGERASEAPGKLGLDCQTWDTWPGMEPFEVCHGGPAQAWGMEAALVTFIGNQDRLVGVQLVFKDCAARRAELQQALARELDLADENVEYHTWQSGEVVRVETRGTECLVTVTDSELGKVYQQHKLRSRGPNLGPR